MGALDTAVRQGKALYAGISSYSAEKTREAAAILHELGTPLASTSRTPSSQRSTAPRQRASEINIWAASSRE
ncbi:MAG: aldo/keto reductase [Thermoleophilia bacterium]|nr:aldo/keto reductase [Thermoleophilia bacterium]